MHRLRKSLVAHLSSELRDKYSRRSLPVRVGDKVEVTRGDFKGLKGKVTEVDTKNRRIAVEGVVITKADESEIPRPVHPSNLVITELESDKRRKITAKEGTKGGEERPEKTSEEA